MRSDVWFATGWGFLPLLYWSSAVGVPGISKFESATHGFIMTGWFLTEVVFKESSLEAFTGLSFLFVVLAG